METCFELKNLVSVFNYCTANIYSLRKFHLEDWSFEQKWVGILLPLLLAFDNPMFAYTLFTSNPLPGAIDAIGQVREISSGTDAEYSKA